MTERLLVVCGTGMGSSMILKIMVDRVVAANKMPFEVTSDLASAARSSGADVLLAGLDLVPSLQGLPMPIIGVKNILDTGEIKQALTDYLAAKAG
ncbi:MAG: PTS sugar transporter subunit IIB [Propionibacteriaceae bacterium]|nr:PTS sugar transporter subunit IIB [Propionibacteriaceae bacterium]